MVTQRMVLDLLKKMSIYDTNIRKVRAGRLRDGGYVIPDDFACLEGVLSFGVGRDVSFDRFFAERGVPVYQYDHTVDGAPAQHKHFFFQKKGLAGEPSNNYITLEDAVSDNLLTTNDLVLKFDIEGFEWDTFAKVSCETLNRFRFIVCELHWINKMPDSYEVFDKYKNVVELLTTNHNVIHFHANNNGQVSLYKGIPIPDVFELTLLRKDRSLFFPSFSPIPSCLDYPNNPNLPDIVLTPYLSWFHAEEKQHAAYDFVDNFFKLHKNVGVGNGTPCAGNGDRNDLSRDAADCFINNCGVAYLGNLLPVSIDHNSSFLSKFFTHNQSDEDSPIMFDIVLRSEMEVINKLRRRLVDVAAKLVVARENDVVSEENLNTTSENYTAVMEKGDQTELEETILEVFFNHLRADLSKMQSKNTEFCRIIEQLEFEKRSLEDSNEKMQVDLKQVQNENIVFKKTIEQLEFVKQTLENTNGQLQADVEQVQSENISFVKTIEKLEFEKKTLENSNVQLQAELEKIRGCVEVMVKNIDSLNSGDVFLGDEREMLMSDVDDLQLTTSCSSEVHVKLNKDIVSCLVKNGNISKEISVLHKLIAEICRAGQALQVISSYFNEKQYLIDNDDVNVAILQGKILSGFYHWYQFGVFEKRSAKFILPCY